MVSHKPKRYWKLAREVCLHMPAELIVFFD